MKILITGATGFVGSCLTRRLVNMQAEQRGHPAWAGMYPLDVHILTRSHANKWRIADLMAYVTNHEVDLRDAEAVARAVSQICPRVIFHLATYGGFAAQKDTAAIVETNFMGTINLLCACAKTGFDCFINTGSSSEYGLKASPMRENDCLEPVGDYGITKAAATLYCRTQALAGGLPLVTLRLFSPYGPWDDHQRLIPYVIKTMLRGGAPLLSTPQSVRDFIYIDDVVDAYLQAVAVPLPQGTILNVGSGRQHSIGEVVELLTKIIAAEAKPSWGQVSSHRPEPGTWVADISKAKHELQWLPATSLWTGLNRTVNWFKKNLALYP